MMVQRQQSSYLLIFRCADPADPDVLFRLLFKQKVNFGQDSQNLGSVFLCGPEIFHSTCYTFNLPKNLSFPVM